MQAAPTRVASLLTLSTMRQGALYMLTRTAIRRTRLVLELSGSVFVDCMRLWDWKDEIGMRLNSHRYRANDCEVT